MGTVYKGYDLRHFRPVIVWILPKTGTYQRKLLLREAEAATQLGHESILKLYEHDVDDETGELVLVFEYLDCRTLGGILADSFPDRPLPEQLALRVLVQTLSVLGPVHKVEVIHRRINPFTILLWQDSVKLAGFGLVYLQQPGSVPLKEVFYMAPEQLAGGLGDERADLYSVGVVSFQMFTGELPFYGVSLDDLRHHVETGPPPSPCILNPQIREDVGAIIVRLLQKDPTSRYQTAVEVLDMLST
jgi:serine/threonine protein kinase